MKLIKSLLNICILLPFYTSFSTPLTIFPTPEEQTLSLQFESIFPDSSYKKVHNLCIDIWQDLRSVKEQEESLDQVPSFNDLLIDDLLLLSRRVTDMLDDPRCCSADDLEYIMEILHIMHREYVQLVSSESRTNESIGISVLFDHIIKTVGKPLDSNQWYERDKKIS